MIFTELPKMIIPLKGIKINQCFLFVCLELIVPLENFSLIWRRHHCRLRAANFDLCSALMAIEQWGFFNVPHQPRHGPTVYYGHLRGPVTLAPNAERGAVTACFNDLGLSRPGIELRSPAYEANALPLRHRGGAVYSTQLKVYMSFDIQYCNE